MTGEHGEADAMTNDDILDELVDLPVCVHCKKPSTLKAQVVERSNRYCRYHAHTSCIERHKKAPPVKADLPQNQSRPGIAARIAQWNALAGEFDRLWAECWSGAHRASATLEEACEAANSLNWSYAQMTSDFRYSISPDQAAEPVRYLHWRVQRLRDALEQDATRAGRRIKAEPRSARNFVLDEDVLPIREDWETYRTELAANATEGTQL